MQCSLPEGGASVQGTMSRLATPSGLNWNLYLKEYPWFVLTETMQPDPSLSTPNIVMSVTSNPSFFAPGFFANRSGITIWATPGVSHFISVPCAGAAEGGNFSQAVALEN